MAEVLLLHVGDQAARVEVIELDGVQPRPQQAAGVLRRDRASTARASRSRLALREQAAHHRHHHGGIGSAAPALRLTMAEGARGQGDSGVGPLGRAALSSARDDRPGAHVCKELRGRARRRGLRPCAPDVHTGVVVRAADPDAVERRDVCGRGPVELPRARPVPHLPHVEQLRQTPTVAGAQGRCDRVIGVGQRA